MTRPEHHWRVPVALDDVSERGLHFTLSADGATREAIATLAAIDGLPRLDAVFDVTRQGRGLRVRGEVSGTVEQTCVVTLDPVTNEVREKVDLAFEPPGAAEVAAAELEAVLDPDQADPPEPLIDGRIDLGRIATEFLVLGVDPYPRKPDAVFASPAAGEGTDSPFAALAGLKKRAGDPD